MAYGLKYIIPFSNYQLKISRKDYSGPVTTLIAATPAVEHIWDKDEPTAPIKGSALEVNVIGLPLIELYSDDDDAFKGELFNGGLRLFSGFLVQDDCREPLDDLQHAARLSFTDNLGLLKDVTFDAALKEVVTKLWSATAFVAATGPENLLFPNSISFSAVATPAIQIDDKIRVTGPVFTGYYTVTAIYQSGTSNVITVAEPLVTTTTQQGVVTLYRTVANLSRITLFAVLQACIKATGIELPLTIYATLKEDSQNTDSSFFEQTLISKESFLKSERTYEDAYTVLEKLMNSFNCQILQANGRWQVKRCYEVSPKAFFYDSDFALTSTGVYNNTRTFGRGLSMFPEYGYEHGIVRPFKRVKETFNYNFAYQILKNADLKELGALLNTYVLDAGTTKERTVNEYAFPHWFENPTAPQSANPFIRIVTDPLDNELERYVVVKNYGIVSTPIEGNEGDSIDFSFNIRTAAPVGLPANLTFVIQLTNGILTRYADNKGGWRPVFGYFQTFTTPLEQWNSVTLKIGRLPFDGKITVYLTDANHTTGRETHYNDLRFEYHAYINESTKITGHTHTNSQVITTKNTQETDISIDDSPRNFIPGTLFLNSSTGIIQNRTKGWAVGFTSTIPIKLGQILTEEVKQWRNQPRMMFEGTLHGENTLDINVSPFTTFINSAFPSINCIPGGLRIDYANKSCKGTLHEVFKTADLLAIAEYKYDYIYSTK